MDTVDRNYVLALIEQAERELVLAEGVARGFGLAETVERLGWAREFAKAAREKVPPAPEA